jgi:hypothetical protein
MRWDAAEMAITDNIEAASQHMFYIESSMPTGMTIAAYRRCRPQHPSLWRRFRIRLA